MKTKRVKEGGNLDKAVFEILHDEDAPSMFPAYSIDWCHGGPIIEKERINLWAKPKTKHRWRATIDGKNIYLGTTPLQAAMICFVATNLKVPGDTDDEQV